MTLAQIEATAAGNAQPAERQVQPDEAAVRRMAAEFESLLLNQLTASLNPKEDDEEAGLFSNNGGLGLARQMFSEQLAKTMSQSGGIGLADMIVRQVMQKSGKVQNRESRRGVQAARAIRAESATRSFPLKPPTSTTSPTGEKYPDAIVISEAAASNSPAPAIVSHPAAEATSTRATNDITAASRPRRVNSLRSEVRAAKDAHALRPSVLTAIGAKHSASAGANVALQLPVRGPIRSVFGPRRDPINGRHRFHQGLDIAARRGTPIEAAAAGTVVFAGRNRGYGNMVLIEHADGRRTLYAHAESLFVRAGEEVRAGQSIAAVGSTGHSTGPHLHFEVREGNQALNPLTVLANDLTLARR